MYRHAVARIGTRWPMAVLIALLALATRLYGLDRKSVWFDEAITYLDAHEPWPRLLEAIRADVHPPLNYVLFHLWPLTDAGDFWLRLPAALLGALAALIAWAWARRVGTPLQALLTGAFVALAPLQIDLAQEARMYGLLLALTATSLWLLDRVLVCPTRLGLAGYALACALLLYTHYYAAFLLAAQSLAALLLLSGAYARGARLAVGALIVAGIAFLPWLPVMVEQARGIQGDYWIAPPTLTTLWVTFRELAAHTPPDAQFPLLLRAAYVVQATLILLGAVLAVRMPRQRVAVLLGAVPLGLAFGISLLVAPVYAVRYISPLGLAFGFLLARGATALPKPYAIGSAVVALAPVLLSVGPLYTDPGYSRADLRAAAAAVSAERQPNDVVLHLGAFTATPFDYYHVSPPGVVLETNDRAELCRALLGHTAGWLVTSYPPADDEARDAAEAGITYRAYAGDLVRGRPLRFLGLSVFHLGPDC
jgi:hypothetical protein